jgi:hypothetical protein
MFNDATLRLIHGILDRAELGSANFIVNDEGYHFIITFKDSPDYYFSVGPDGSGAFKYDLREAPGIQIKNDRTLHDKEQTVIDRIYPWANRVNEELNARGEMRRKLQLNAVLDEYIKTNYPDPFAAVRSEDFERVASEMEKFRQEIEQLQKDHKATKEQVAAVKKIVDELVSSATKTTGSAWLRKFAGTMGQLIKIAADNPHIIHKILELGEHAGRLLGQ